jgi:hypothetical protein
MKKLVLPLAAAGLGGIAFLALAPAALAASGPSVGAGIGDSPVCLGVTAQPGGSYPIGGNPAVDRGPAGTVLIQNTGSGTEEMQLRVMPPVKLPGSTLAPGSWISFSYGSGQQSVQVPAGQYQYIPAVLRIPAGTRSGTYSALAEVVTVAPQSPGEGARVSVQAGAAETLAFSVRVRPPDCGVSSPAQSTDSLTGPLSPPAQQPSAPYGIERTPLIGIAGLLLLVAGVRMWRGPRAG